MDSNFQFRARRAEVLTGLYRRRPSKVFAFPPKRPAPCTRDRWFESVSLQRRVCKPSVPQRRSLSLLETGDEHSRIGPVKNRDRTAPAAFPPASGDDRTVASGMVELDRHPVGAVHLDAIDRGVDPAGAGVAHDDDAARSLSRSLKQPRLEGATPNPISSLSGSPSLQTKLRCTTSKTMASPNTPTTDASTTLRSAAPAAKTPSMSIVIQGLRGKSKHCPRTCCLR